jgi:hypothetical protein
VREVNESMTDLGERCYLLVTIAVEILLCVIDGCKETGIELVYVPRAVVRRHSLMPPLMPLGKAAFCIIGTRLYEPLVCLKNIAAVQ